MKWEATRNQAASLQRNLYQRKMLDGEHAVGFFLTKESKEQRMLYTLLLSDLLICWLFSPLSCTNKANKRTAAVASICVAIHISVRHDICSACIALTYIKLWLIPPDALYLHRKEETAAKLGLCAQTEVFDVSCPCVLQIICNAFLVTQFFSLSEFELPLCRCARFLYSIKKDSS